MKTNCLKYISPTSLRDFISVPNACVHTGRPQRDRGHRVNHLIACMEDSGSAN